MSPKLAWGFKIVGVRRCWCCRAAASARESQPSQPVTIDPWLYEMLGAAMAGHLALCEHARFQPSELYIHVHIHISHMHIIGNAQTRVRGVASALGKQPADCGGK